MTPLLIVCRPHSVTEIELAIQALAHPRAIEYIHIVGIEPAINERIWEINRRVFHEANKLATEKSARQCSILVDKGINVNIAALRQSFIDVEKVSLTVMRSAQFRLRYLSLHRLSVVSFAERLLGYWTHASITGLKVEAWLRQFDEIGYSWLGERLLRLVEVVSPSQLADDLFASLTPRSSDFYCVMSDPQVKGKSAEVISNLLSRRFPAAQIGAEPTVLIEKNINGVLHIFEDGLFTGTEVIGVLESLLGQRETLGKRNKVRPLSDAKLLRNTEVVLHFARGSDYGLLILNHYLAQRALKNVSVSIPPHGEISVLSTIGRGILQEIKVPGSIWDEGPPQGTCTPYIFSESRFWDNTTDRSQASTILEELGGQLFRRYIERKERMAGWTMWPEDKLSKCSMGMWGFGLPLAFSHSVPKASLPVLWSDGCVTVAGKQVHWQPLFKNADVIFRDSLLPEDE